MFGEGVSSNWVRRNFHVTDNSIMNEFGKYTYYKEYSYTINIKSMETIF